MDLNTAMPVTHIKDFAQTSQKGGDKFKPQDLSNVIVNDPTAASPKKETFALSMKDDLSMLDPKELKCLLSGGEVKFKDKNK